MNVCKPLNHRIRQRVLCATLTLAIGLAGTAARAHPGASEASAVSVLPVALSVAVSAAPAFAGSMAVGSVLASSAVFTVVAVHAVSGASVWVLERASDGVRISVQLAAGAATGVALSAGTVVVATAFSAGWVLSAAGKAIAYIPNEIGKALVCNERVTR